MERSRLYELIIQKSGSVSAFAQDAGMSRAKMYRILHGQVLTEDEVDLLVQKLGLYPDEAASVLFGKVPGIDEPLPFEPDPNEPIPEDPDPEEPEPEEIVVTEPEEKPSIWQRIRNLFRH
jgi:hypothetical protein